MALMRANRKPPLDDPSSESASEIINKSFELFDAALRKRKPGDVNTKFSQAFAVTPCSCLSQSRKDMTIGSKDKSSRSLCQIKY